MNSSLQQAFLGSLVADAVAMPVHWYYDTQLLDRDYPELNDYTAPRNPHAGSILWRSHYRARNEKGEILHDQAQYWGQRGIHYHQFLDSGENTVNYQLAAELHRLVVERGAYDADAWLDRYIECLRTPGWHRDTYLEEYHRAFFDNYARGKKPRDCGIKDIHIGGIATVPALVAALDVVGTNPTEIPAIVREHVVLTHQAPPVDAAALALTRMLLAIADGEDLASSIQSHATGWIGAAELDRLAMRSDREIIGRRFSPACYMPESFTASLALVWKHRDSFSGGILANARCGGDNCHRGAVVGSLLGGALGIETKWRDGLKASIDHFAEASEA
ncbi:MAG: ADP-ribosylglycohydrolase family protein [Verrucomicrobiota bacterium]